MTKHLDWPFLVAMPTLSGSFFEGALILLVEHDAQGAWGVIVNRPSDVKKSDVLKALNPKFTETVAEQTVYLGGPVAPEHGFVLHQPCADFFGEHLLAQGLAVSCRQSLLEAQAHGADIQEYLMTLGYCGWSEGQLEQEIKDNCWLQTQGDIPAILQQPSGARVDAALSALGVQYQQLHDIAGHS